jgi:hypothetical protein
MTSDPLPPWAARVESFTVSCTRCGEVVKNDEENVLFFTVAEAVEYMTEYVDGQIDGDTLTCASCLAADACTAAGGHDIQTITHPDRPGMAWYCGRENCRARGFIREDPPAGGSDSRPAGTRAGGEGDPAQTEATSWDTRSLDYPTAPAPARRTGTDEKQGGPDGNA